MYMYAHYISPVCAFISEISERLTNLSISSYLGTHFNTYNYMIFTHSRRIGDLWYLPLPTTTLTTASNHQTTVPLIFHCECLECMTRAG